MQNLGIATPTVKLIPRLPNVGAVTKINFDVGATNWETIQNSPFFSPLLMEELVDPVGSLAVLHPSKRIYWVDNYLEGGTKSITHDTSESPMITWTPLALDRILETETGIKPIVSSIIKNKKGEFVFDEYVLIQPRDYVDAVFKADYLGPYWKDSAISKEPPPNDAQSIAEFEDWVKAGEPNDDPEPTPEPTAEETATEEEVDAEESAAVVEEEEVVVTPLPSIGYVYQENKRDGLWWAIESSSFLTENMPFWITAYRANPPTTEDKDTVMLISLGLTDKSQRFDIYLSMNNKPRIIDYVSLDDKGAPQIQKEFDGEGSRILSHQRDFKIGIMTVAGRLVVWVNPYNGGDPMVYTRVNREKGDNGGTLLECKIAQGPIRIFGTNAECAINVSPMTFAEKGLMAVAVPVLSSDSESASTSGRFRGVKWDGTAGGSVCHLPTPPSNPESQIFGCDCESFSGDGGSASPVGFGFHNQGEIRFKKASSDEFSALPSTEFFTLQMKPSSTSFEGFNLPFGGCPYYFRLKGINIKNDELETGESANITNSVISISETATAPDYFHCKKSATIQCYDEGGAISSALIRGQSGVEISWGWSQGEVTNSVKTFTGVVSNISLSQKAGMETVTINVEDYMYLLKRNPMLNSPYYDGMVAFYAIQDMAERGGISGFINDWESTNEYFLPAGYAFTQPRMRYQSSQTIFDCIMDIIKRMEGFVYFDEDGNLVMTRLPGGLFSSGQVSVKSFFSDPTSAVGTVILDEKQVDLSYESTVNVIVAMTLERDTRNAVIYMKKAKGTENNLIFRKVSLYKQGALGELEVCRGYVEDLAQRTFYPILKCRWKTAGTGVEIIPLSFVDVDYQQFRVTSVKRNFSADSNDLTTSYEGEWLGGAAT